MIRLLGRLPLALALVVPGTWAALFALEPDPGRLRARAEGSWRRACPGDEEVRGPGGESRPGGPERPGKRVGPFLRAAFFISRLHVRALGRTAAAQGLGVLAGLLGGLAFRERLRTGDAGYASPAAAGLGRMLVFAGLFWGAVWALCPLPVDPGWVYAVSLGAAPGSFLYVANLPLRL